MPRLLALLVLLGMLSPFPARCDEPPPEQTTHLAGTVPDLAGRWLFVARVEVAPKSPLVTTTTSLWDVTLADGKPVVTLRQVALPQGVQESLAKAGDAHEAWEPTARDLADLDGAW